MDLGSDEELPEGVGWVSKTAMAYVKDESMFARRSVKEDDMERAKAALRYVIFIPFFKAHCPACRRGFRPAMSRTFLTHGSISQRRNPPSQAEREGKGEGEVKG